MNILFGFWIVMTIYFLVVGKDGIKMRLLRAALWPVSTLIAFVIVFVFQMIFAAKGVGRNA